MEALNKNKEKNIIRYFNARIRLEKAIINNLKAKKFKILVENEKNCSIITYPYYYLKWKIKEWKH